MTVAYHRSAPGRSWRPASVVQRLIGAVIGVSGHAVGPERHDEVGLDVGDVAGDGDRCRRAARSGRLRNRADGARRHRARRGCCGARVPRAPRAGPAARSRIARSVLAERGGDHDDAITAPAELCHQPGRQVGLVVGMCPDAEQRPRLHGRVSSSRAASVSTSSAMAELSCRQQRGDLVVVPLLAGDAVDDVEQRDAEPVADGLVVPERVVQRRLVAEPVDDGTGEEVGVAERVGEPVSADRIVAVAGVADECPSGAGAAPHVARIAAPGSSARGADARRSRSASPVRLRRRRSV